MSARVLASLWCTVTVLHVFSLAKFWSYYGAEDTATQMTAILAAASAGVWQWTWLEASQPS